MPRKTITIAGGGLAGLTLGTALRQRGIPVTIWEAGHYPRHRVCGEFISGAGQSVLEQLGLRELLMSAGAILARQTVFFFGNAASPPRPVKPAAICLSRYTIDALLAQEFEKLGGDLRQGAAQRESRLGEGTVRATGRRVQPVQNGWRWFGLKAHARNVELSADLEMHCLPNQYVGLGRIEDDKVNVCGLFRRHAGDKDSHANRHELLLGPPGSILRQRLEKAEWDERSFCSVAGLPLQPQRAAGRNECCIGDALTMIPPATGNGMSMAFEAAGAAIEPLEQYCLGKTSWAEACEQVALGCDRLFSRRLRWAAWLQRLLFASYIQNRFGRLALNSGFVWNILFARTR